MNRRKLPLSFYQQSNVVDVAKQLVGKMLCTQINGESFTSGIITETEAYCGCGDKACHANDGTRTKRTETMYQSGGIAYIYLCYGIHHLFNVVTNTQNKADAVLVRAIEPLDGKQTMLKRRSSQKVSPKLTAGPGRLTEAMGITTGHDTISLTSDTIWIEEQGHSISEDELIASKRIGVDYAGDDANRRWRFYPENSKWVSQK